jgi:hypothetical protein
MTSLEVLMAAKGLIAIGHCTGMARDAKGRLVTFSDPTAVSFSLAGAVNQGAKGIAEDAFRAWQFVRAACMEHEGWRGDVGSLQDSMSQADVLVLVDRAIDLAKAPVKRRAG